MASIARMLRTATHLRPTQIINRAARRIPRSIAVSALDMPVRAWRESWTACPGRRVLLTAPERICLLNQEASIAAPSIWNDLTRPKLWLYQLHYFDDLVSESAPARAQWHCRLIERWIKENPPSIGNGWEPYTISRRIVNWIAWALAGGNLSASARASVVVQTRVLVGRLEYHLLGNHLFSNARALVFAGSFFDGPEASGWLRKGLAILDEQFQEQILADGGQFELSPMYHALAIEDIIDLIQLERCYSDIADLRSRVDVWRASVGKMMSWLRAMSHPDGKIAFFNDATFFEARNSGDLEAYAVQFGCSAGAAPESLTYLRDSGYIRLGRNEWCVIFDAAQIGPSYIPGHGHADTLSFEISLGHERIITNSGISTYSIGAQRERERSTAAHATVEIDGENSSEVWASFRVGRRARPFDVGAEAWAQKLVCHASHDGYRFLYGRPVHSRRIEVDSAGVLICDRIEQGEKHSSIGRLPLHPSVQFVQVSDFGFKLLTRKGVALDITIQGADKCFVEEGSFAPEFGLCLSRPVIAWTCYGSRFVRTVISTVH